MVSIQDAAKRLVVRAEKALQRLVHERVALGGVRHPEVRGRVVENRPEPGFALAVGRSCWFRQTSATTAPLASAISVSASAISHASRRSGAYTSS